jgi:spermidine/putrescine-binding protein
MFFSDNQLYSDLNVGFDYFGYSRNSDNRSQFERSWNNYLRINPSAKIYMFDLSSYGSYPIDLMRENIYMVSGWSPQIFSVLGGLEKWKELKQYILVM